MIQKSQRVAPELGLGLGLGLYNRHDGVHEEVVALMEARFARERAERSGRAQRSPAQGTTTTTPTTTPASFLREQISGTFMNRAEPYVYPDRKQTIVFDPDCKFNFQNCVFVASHREPEPLAWVRNGSLLVNLPGPATFWVRKLVDTEGARRLVSNIKGRQIKGCSLRFHVQSVRESYVRNGHETIVAGRILIEHISAERFPGSEWTSIKVF